MNKAVFLDRDGTINVEKNYLYRIEDFEFIPGVVQALKVLQNKGYLLIIITNQSGIARGYYTEDEFTKLNNWMIAVLEEQGVHITATYYCPHLPNAKIGRYKMDCDCRKPKIGLFERAVRDLKIDLDKSFAIGDRIRDCSICAHSKCQGFLIGQNEQARIIDKVKSGRYAHVKYCDDLPGASQLIL